MVTPHSILSKNSMSHHVLDVVCVQTMWMAGDEVHLYVVPATNLLLVSRVKRPSDDESIVGAVCPRDDNCGRICYTRLNSKSASSTSMFRVIDACVDTKSREKIKRVRLVSRDFVFSDIDTVTAENILFDSPFFISYILCLLIRLASSLRYST